MRPILRKAERPRLAKELTARISAVGTLSELSLDSLPCYMVQGKHGKLRVSFFIADDSAHCISLFTRWEDIDSIPSADRQRGFETGKRNVHIGRGVALAYNDRVAVVLWHCIDHLRQLGVDIESAPSYW